MGGSRIPTAEGGPTHQPVEHQASLRAIPNVRLLRPADAEETAEALIIATGSEVGLALEAVKLAEQGARIRVVSMISRERGSSAARRGSGAAGNAGPGRRISFRWIVSAFPAPPTRPPRPWALPFRPCWKSSPGGVRGRPGLRAAGREKLLPFVSPPPQSQRSSAGRPHLWRGF
jgi:hypothetical protein